MFSIFYFRFVFIRSLQVAQCAQAAVASYEEFLKSFETENGALPDRIDADNEHYFVSACFSLGRCLHHASERRGTALLEKARYRVACAASSSFSISKTDNTTFEAILLGECFTFHNF